jgi:hypothetical protein
VTVAELSDFASHPDPCSVTTLRVPGVQCGVRGGVEEFRGPVRQGAELRCFICNRQGLKGRILRFIQKRIL